MGLTIPAELYDRSEWPLKPTLSYSGEMWAKQELKKIRRADIVFWAKLILPIVSLVLSIISIFIALVKKH